MKTISPMFVLAIFILGVFLTSSLCSCSGASVRNEDFYQNTIRSIACDIEGLKTEFPQLTNFSTADNCQAQNFQISYAYHTHWPKHRGGWTSGVPNPDMDGIWFYINFHDQDSMAQIDTQPVMESLVLGDKRITLLILEGDKTKSIYNRIHTILLNHGASNHH